MVTVGQGWGQGWVQGPGGGLKIGFLGGCLDFSIGGMLTWRYSVFETRPSCTFLAYTRFCVLDHSKKSQNKTKQPPQVWNGTWAGQKLSQPVTSGVISGCTGCTRGEAAGLATSQQPEQERPAFGMQSWGGREWSDCVGTSHSSGLWPRVLPPWSPVLMDRKGQRLSP